MAKVRMQVAHRDDSDRSPSEYGQVMRMLGNGRVEVQWYGAARLVELSCQCSFDGSKRLCHIRGKMRKKVWVNQGVLSCARKWLLK
jgi:initiation factor 1A